MKTTSHPSLRLSLLALVLAASAAVLSAKPVETTDRAARLLAQQGRVVLENAGPFVEHGTYLVQVAVKLGRPHARLADGTWLYHHRRIEGSAAEGTLVVRFTNDRVSELALVTPTIATALTTARDAATPLLAKK